MELKEAIIEAIAKMYSTTAGEVANDIAAMSMAQQNLEEFCDAMKDAGY